MEKITKGVRKSSIKIAIDFYNVISSENPYTIKPSTNSLRKLVISKGVKSIDSRKIKFFIDKNLRIDKDRNVYYFITLDEKRVANLAKEACEYSYNIKLNEVSTKSTSNSKKSLTKKPKTKNNTKTISILWGLIKYQIN